MNSSKKNSRLVYSTEIGRVKPSGKESSPPVQQPASDGIIRIHKEVSGRKGKGVSIIKGLNLPNEEHKALLKSLKQHCGSGGAVKNNALEIQGDHREKIKLYLENKGYTVKLAGG